VTRLRAVFHFDIGELFVREVELGGSYPAPNEPRARIALPGAEPAFELAVGRGGFMERPLTGASISKGDNKIVGVRMIQVSVTLDADLSAAEFDAGDGPVDKAYDVWDSAYATASEVFQRFRAAARVQGNQYWIGMAHDAPQLIGLQRLEDLDAGGTRIPVGYPRTGAVAVMLDPASVVPVEAHLQAASEEPPIAETLLADARATYWPKVQTGQDHQRAVLLAAIAVEVKVKQHLQDLASPELRPLVEVIVQNPRDVTQSVPQLLREPLKTVMGHSLFESNRPLWDRVKRLFEVRNALAHRAKLPSEAQGRDAVRSAGELFQWLVDHRP
jgi:hypothetical protein